MAFLSNKQAMKNSQLFGENHGLTPLQKIKFCQYTRSTFLWAKVACFLLRTTPNNILWPFLSKKETEKNSNFRRKSWVNPFTKIKFHEYIKSIHKWVKRLVSYSEHHQTIFYGLFRKKQAMKKTQIFGQNHGLNP